MQQDITAIHQPVLLNECVQLMAPALAEQSIAVDCTLGLAGHTIAFLKACPQARVIGIDRDAQALSLATQRIEQEGLASRFTPVHAAFDEFEAVLHSLNIDHVQAVFMDLGLSSLQIDETDRGFAYAHNAPLDMRMDTSQQLSAADILATYSAFDLTRIFREYGQEKFAKQIANAIVREREAQSFTMSAQLTDLVDRVMPKSSRPAGNPAKRVFQALRIEVNGELDKLARTLPQALLHLSVGGRLVVESYHSLEDIAVKRIMRAGMQIDAPSDLPIIPPDAMPFLKDVSHGAIQADEEEKARNPRSKSVRLRACEVTRELPEKWVRNFNEMKQESSTTQKQHTHNKARRKR